MNNEMNDELKLQLSRDIVDMQMDVGKQSDIEIAVEEERAYQKIERLKALRNAQNNTDWRRMNLMSRQLDRIYTNTCQGSEPKQAVIRKVRLMVTDNMQIEDGRLNRAIRKIERELKIKIDKIRADMCGLEDLLNGECRKCYDLYAYEKYKCKNEAGKNE